MLSKAILRAAVATGARFSGQAGRGAGGRRLFSSQAAGGGGAGGSGSGSCSSSSSCRSWLLMLLAGGAAGAGGMYWYQSCSSGDKKPGMIAAAFGCTAAKAAGESSACSVDFAAVRKDIEALLEAPEGYDDGSYGPVFVRLAWHASGTYDCVAKNGGSNGGLIRFQPEAGWGANAGLQIARDRLEPLKRKYPGLSYADLYTLSGVVAIESMGGPKVAWRPGRVDFADGSRSPPDGRLPDASKGAQHIRDVFYRMGFNDQEIVALIGAHALGRCHTDRSGYDGPWTRSPTTFSNDFFNLLKNEKWTKKSWKGPEQFEDAAKEIMMTPADLAFLSDPAFRKQVDIYAADEKVFFADFANAFAKLLELGVAFPPAADKCPISHK